MQVKRFSKNLAVLGLCTAIVSGAFVVTPVTNLDAATDNRVTVTQKVKKDTELRDGNEPQLVLKLEDDLTKNNTFYLELKNAEWLPDGTSPGDKITVDCGIEGATFDIVRQGKGLLEVTFTGGKTTEEVDDGLGGTTTVEKAITVIPAGKSLKINLRTKVLKGEAVVMVDGNSTVISSSEETFALVDTSGINVIVKEVPTFSEDGEISPITIEESYKGAFLAETETIGSTSYAVFKVQLNNNDFEFASTGTIKVQPIKGFSSVSSSEIKVEKEDDDELIFKVPETAIKNKEKGGFTITGIEVEATVNDPDEGDLEVTVSGDFMKAVDVVVAKIASYTLSTKITPVDKEFKEGLIAGRMAKYKVELKESIKDTVANGRALVFEIEEGYMIDAGTRSRSEALDAIAKAVKLPSTMKLSDVILDDTKVVGFAVDMVAKSDDIDEYELTIPVIANLDSVGIFTEERLSASEKESTAPTADTDDYGDTSVNFGGGRTSDDVEVTAISYDTEKKSSDKDKKEVTLVISGRAISNDKIETKIASIVKPVDISIKEVKVKTGLKDQKGSDITIEETNPGMIQKGDIIFMFDDEDGLSFSKPPKVEVTSGDLRLGKGELIRSGRSIVGVSFEVTKPSRKEASTIVLSDVVITADRTVPEGDTGILVGGKALIEQGEPVASDYFVHVATLNTDDQITNTNNNINNTVNQAKKEIEAVFTIDRPNYTVNGQAKQMDAAPYIDNGRTMMPVRYVADAFGIKENQILFQNGIITILNDNKTIQLKIGSNIMLLNGAQIPMDVKTTTKNDRTYVPVAYIASALNTYSYYNASNRTVTFNNVADPKLKAQNANFTTGADNSQLKPVDAFDQYQQGYNESQGYYDGNW